MAQGVVRGLIEIWELAVVTIFFLATISAIVYVFDEQQFEKTLFVREIEEVTMIMPNEASITMNKPEFIDVEKTSKGIEISLKEKDDSTTVISTRDEIELSQNQGVLTLHS